jgi:transcriptional regulator with XRE-family HTH domain
VVGDDGGDLGAQVAGAHPVEQLLQHVVGLGHEHGQPLAVRGLGQPPGELPLLREQRQGARLSLRQLSELAGVSNPYLSQIERGLKRPSAEILQQLAKGLEVSAESLYVRAGILDAEVAPPTEAPDVRRAIAADPALTTRQRKTLLDIYESYVEESPRQ